MGWHPLRKRREREFARLDAFRCARKLLDEDITVLGEQLAQLQVETMGTAPGWAMSADYEKAVGCHTQATFMRGSAKTAEDVATIDAVLNDGRFHLACVLARRDGTDLPTPGASCFFNPQHGPGVTDVAWALPGGNQQQIQVCRLDANHLAAGEPPDVRMVRIGDRYVPWYAAGGSITTITDHSTHEEYRGRTAQSDLDVNEAKARGDMSKMEGWLHP